MPLPHDPGPHWGEVGIHGLHRQREWDALTTVDAPEVWATSSWFVALADGRTVVEEGDGGGARLAAALELTGPTGRAPSGARARSGWSPGGGSRRGARRGSRRRHDRARLDGPGADGADRRLADVGGVPELERLGSRRHTAFVVTAARIDGSTWEVAVTPL